MLALMVVSVVVVTKLAMEAMAVFRRSVVPFSSSLRDDGWVNQISSDSKLIVSDFSVICKEYSNVQSCSSAFDVVFCFHLDSLQLLRLCLTKTCVF